MSTHNVHSIPMGEEVESSVRELWCLLLSLCFTEVSEDDLCSIEQLVEFFNFSSFKEETLIIQKCLRDLNRVLAHKFVVNEAAKQEFLESMRKTYEFLSSQEFLTSPEYTAKPKIKPSVCYCCGKYTKVMRCQRCKKAKYCSPECQRADWSNHKTTCSHRAVGSISRS